MFSICVAIFYKKFYAVKWSLSNSCRVTQRWIDVAYFHVERGAYMSLKNSSQIWNFVNWIVVHAEIVKNSSKTFLIHFFKTLRHLRSNQMSQCFNSWHKISNFFPILRPLRNSNEHFCTCATFQAWMYICKLVWTLKSSKPFQILADVPVA